MSGLFTGIYRYRIMKFLIKIFLFSVFLSGFISCGADKLKPTKSSNEVAFNSAYSPVCAGGVDFENIDMAKNQGAINIMPGHCHCENFTTLVCGNNGQDYSECDAKANNIEIIKYIPCAAKGL